MAAEPQMLDSPPPAPTTENITAQRTVVEFQDAKTCCGDFLQSAQNAQVSNASTAQQTNQKVLKMTDFSELSVISEKSEGSEVSGASKPADESDGSGSRSRRASEHNSYAANRNVAEGLMDIALLSANANQLRFLITYNRAASTYYISLGLIALSLTLQVAVGIALIFKRRLKRQRDKRFTRTNEFLIGGVFMVTVVNILLAAFTTTDDKN